MQISMIADVYTWMEDIMQMFDCDSLFRYLSLECDVMSSVNFKNTARIRAYDCIVPSR
jgi:hypothetical protein